MKKGLATILFLIYLTTVSGVGINLHYCCGHLDKVELSYAAKTFVGHSTCAMHSTYKGKDCCKDVHKQIKITQSQNIVSDMAVPAVSFFAVVLPTFPKVPAPCFSSIAKGSFSPHAPPFRATAPLYLKNCSFLI
ncbi:HYC_CC_PP family protein [Arachidicoccus ginsenosidivorans]